MGDKLGTVWCVFQGRMVAAKLMEMASLESE